MKPAWLIGIFAGVVLAVTVAGKYNSLVSAEESVNTAYSQVQNVLQRQADLIPNLVETVKGYAAHESKTLIQVAEARSKVTALSKIDPKDLASNEDLQKKLIEAQATMNQAAISLNAVKEAYPQLQANDNFKSLMAELSGSINRVTVERMRAQKAVQSYNLDVRSFPGKIVASVLGFSPKPYFQATDSAQSAPTVKF